MKNKKSVLISLAALVFLFIGATFFYDKSQKDELSQYSDKGSAPYVRSYSPTFGENRKDVTIVEFMDPECEVCGVFHPAIKKVFKEYEEDVKLVIRYLDIHKNSAYVIKILEASRNQNRYSEVLDIIFEMQPVWAAHGNSKPELIWSYLTNVDGLDIQKLKEDFETLDIGSILKTDRMDAGTLNVRGTPTFFVNGKELEKLSYEKLLDLVEEEIYK